MKRPLLHRLLWLVALTGLLEGVRVRGAEPVAISLYDKDPHHVWNRLYSALMARAPESDATVNDLLDPPFWANTRHLLDDATNRRAVALLGELVNAQPRPDSMSAVQRAVMQRDLLGVFHWLTNLDRHEKDPLPAAQRELAGALVRAIRSVALTAEEIHKLPDNYAAAVAAPDIITTYDPAHPGPFLPMDLLADDGPWVALEPQDNDALAATVHFTDFKGRSAFEASITSQHVAHRGDTVLSARRFILRPRGAGSGGT